MGYVMEPQAARAAYPRAAAVIGVMVVVLSLFVAIPPDPAHAIPFNWTRLTNNAFPETAPVVEAGRLAWIGQDETGWGIYVHDSLWGWNAVRKVSSEGDDWGSVTLGGDLVVWTTHLPGPYAIKLEHIPSGEERDVAFPTTDGMEVSTDGRYIAWADKAGASAPGDVFLYDFRSGQTKQLTNDALDESMCIVDGGYVVWQRESLADPDNKVEILAYDTRTAQITVLTTHALRYRGFALDAGRVAWLQHDFTHSDIFVHDLASGQGKIVVATPTSKSFLGLHGDKLVWSDGWNDSFETCVVDLDDPTPTVPAVLTDNAAADVFAQTDGRFVAWDHRPATGDQVHVYDTAGGGYLNLAQGFMEPREGLSRGRVGWSAGSWPSTEVWTAVFPLFDDVGFGHYFEAIQGMAERGLIAGYPKASGAADFRPENDVLRAQFAKMICGALRLFVSEDAVLPPFTDLGPDNPTDLYMHEYVAAAYAAGITTGTTATTFSPYASITRAQAVTMVYRGARQLHPGLLAQPPAGWSGSLGNFSPTHQAAMQALEFNGILAQLEGFGPGWDPWQQASRAEVAEILWQLMKRIAATWGQ